MRAIDAAAIESVQTLIERAGLSVSIAAARMMGGTYGKRVVVLAGTGNNGADGRVAGRRLAERGAQVTVLDTVAMPRRVPPCDLVIDAAFGTGFHGEWVPPEVGSTPVLAVDIPSGVDGLTGECGGGVLPAERTVTFAALKPGLIVPPGSAFTGTLEVVDIGLDVSGARAHLVQRADVAAWVPRRETDAHKWRAALWVIAGSDGMMGAARLAVGAAMRAGAGMVYLSTPGGPIDPMMPTEVVGRPVIPRDWAKVILDDSARFHAFVVGPGMGRADETAAQIRRFVEGCPRPLVIDGDGLFALGWGDEGAASLLRSRTSSTVLTPHDGEYALLVGERVGSDRMAAARFLAARTGAVVLLKGPASIIAEPSGRVLVVTAGDERLATAGTGDVLSGIIGALLAGGVPAFEAAAAGAWLHGRAARLGPSRGLVAGDIAAHIPEVLESL